MGTKGVSVMKISILAVLALLVSSYAFAETSAVTTVKITSFTHLGDIYSTMGELCGTVALNTEVLPTVANLVPVTITADPDTSNPGSYTVLADRNGKFCAIINANSGSAQAEAWIARTHVSVRSGVAHVAYLNAK